MRVEVIEMHFSTTGGAMARLPGALLLLALLER